MTTQPDHPLADRLADYLRNELSREDEAELEQHVSQCESCQSRLDNVAAEEDWWKEASTYLGDDPIDEEFCMLDELSIDEECERPSWDTRQIVSWLDPTDDPRMLGRLAGYEIAGVIGSGGMAVVLKGLDTALNRFVAIKVLAPHLASSGAARQRFAREAQAAAAVVHENVIAIHGVAEANELPYLVMPYVRGISLQTRLDKEGPLSVSELLRIAMQTAAGLAAAHAQGLVHRDVKPANILLNGSTDRVLLTDFGLARAADDASLTRSGIIAGTPHFMSPEQACGDCVDARSDLFSLGSVMFAMATGRTPFRSETSWGVLQKVIQAKSFSATELNPDIPLWLSSLIAKLHAKAPENRIQSAAELRDVLEQCLAHVHHPTTQPLPLKVVHANKTRHPLLKVFGGISLCLVVGLVVFWVSGGRFAKEQAIGSGEATKSSSFEHGGTELPSSDLIVQNAETMHRPFNNNVDPTNWNDGSDEMLRDINKSITDLEKNEAEHE